MSQPTHPIVGMYPNACSSIDCFFSFIKSRIGVSKSNSHSFPRNCTNKVFYTFAFWRKGDFIEQAISCFLPSTKLIHAGVFHIGRVLGSLVFLCEIRPFKIDPTNLGSTCFLVMSTDIFCYRKQLLVRGSQRRWQEAGNTCAKQSFTHSMKGSFDVIVHDIDTTKSMNMGIHKSWGNAITGIVNHLSSLRNLFYMLAKLAIHKFQVTATTNSVWVEKLIRFNIIRHNDNLLDRLILEFIMSITL